MLPQPTDHLGLLRIPGPGLNALAIRFAPLSDRDQFDPSSWMPHALTQSVTFPSWWEIDLDLLGLVDGDYEYEFVVNGATVCPDPYADNRSSTIGVFLIYSPPTCHWYSRALARSPI